MRGRVGNALKKDRAATGLTAPTVDASLTPSVEPHNQRHLVQSECCAFDMYLVSRDVKPERSFAEDGSGS
jgi:hypothetical protein